MISTEPAYSTALNPTEANSIYDINKLNVDKDVGDTAYHAFCFLPLELRL